ncbi:MAG: RHS repeat-associated core domain-containing protein, partial [Fibrobacter sp.]|nr:RHS repeat-associated core domain-containing protein [Fibrobacter sp.]
LGANYFSVKIFDSIGRVEAVGEVQGQYSFTNPDADIPGSNIKLHERFVYGKPTPENLMELLNDNTLADSILAAMENIKALDVGAHITYGDDGNMTSVSMASFDRMGQKNKQWMVYGLGGLPAVQLYYNYNAAGELVNSSYSQWENGHWQAKSQRKRQYDSQGRLTHTFEVVNGADKLMASYEYTANGNTKNKSYYDQGSEVFTKQILTDIHGRPTQLKYTKGNAPLYTQSLTYEKPWASRMQVVSHDYHQLNHSGASVLNYHYSYDYLGRLSEVSGPKNANYSYDNLGRLTSKFEDNIGVGYAYSPDRYRPQFYGVTGRAPNAHQVAFDYDSSGNVWFDQYRSTAYKLDAAGLPLTAYKLKHNATYNQVTNGTLPESHYGDKLEMAYSGGNRLWYSYHSDDNMSYTEATFSGVGVYKSIDSNDFSLQRLDLIGGGYRAMNQNGENRAYFPITDAQGNVRMYANRQGVVSAYDYLPYGMTITLKEDSETDRKRWQSKEYDGEHDKYYFGARYFDPLFGQWMSPDPAGQFANPYSYGNDPINYIDPNGEAVHIVAGAGIGAVSGLVQCMGSSEVNCVRSVTVGVVAGGLTAFIPGLVGGIGNVVAGATGLSTGSGLLAAAAGEAAKGAAIASLSGGVAYTANQIVEKEKWDFWIFSQFMLIGGVSGGLAGGLKGAVHYGLSDRFKWQTHQTVLEYGNEKAQGGIGDFSYIEKMGEYVAKRENIDVPVIRSNDIEDDGKTKFRIIGGKPEINISWQTGYEASGEFSASNFYTAIVHEHGHIKDAQGDLTELYGPYKKMLPAKEASSLKAFLEVRAIQNETINRFYKYYDINTTQWVQKRHRRFLEGAKYYIENANSSGRY